MKKILTACIASLITLASFAQHEKSEADMKGKFRQDNIFVGSSLGLSLGNGGFAIGANPEIGYSIANWLDAGLSGNINYFSYRAEYNDGYRQRSTNYGGGVFVRVYPIRSFFIQLLPEYNRINTTLTDMRFTPNVDYKLKQKAPSFLAGIGYGTRIVGASSFFTVLMIDLNNNEQSPYVDGYGAKLPVLRTGFNIYLRPKRQK